MKFAIAALIASVSADCGTLNLNVCDHPSDAKPDDPLTCKTNCAASTVDASSGCVTAFPTLLST